MLLIPPAAGVSLAHQTEANKVRAAHIHPSRGDIHELESHLISVAQLAKHFASAFSDGSIAFYAGLWHDLGKYSNEFQRYLAAAVQLSYSHRGGSLPPKVNHSTAGALHAEDVMGPVGRVVSYLVAGHHAGLPDWESENSGRAGLAQRLEHGRRHSLLGDALAGQPPLGVLRPNIDIEPPEAGTDPALFIRMLFSCLVDADFLDTEQFMDADKARRRESGPPLADLLELFRKYMDGKLASASQSHVNNIRRGILNRCIEKAASSPGVFTLTVPTGGGKTLSSMAFALNHAVRFGKTRVIYVIPYTSIIEQTADEFRRIFGDAVIEHHSNFDPHHLSRNDGLTEERALEFERFKLASENWDAPIIVTTSVQFFESLFAARTSRCRKIHNICNSVVILDEAQLLPPDYLSPILHCLKQLVNSFGATIVLSTATQPALSKRTSFDFKFPGFEEITEIVNDPRELHADLRRVRVEVPEGLFSPVEWSDLAVELSRHDSCLCVVNRRDDCRELHRHMPEDTVHLSALMCGAHRSQVIAGIKLRLSQGQPIRVISTQLVEAGVDLDFPVVYRALAGLDSIAQAAGRCNREGRLPEGRVVVFVPPSKTPKGHLRQAEEIARQLLGEGSDDPLSLESFERFFRQLYWVKGDGLDRRQILNDLKPRKPELGINFRTAAHKFRIIDESLYRAVLVRYGEGSELIDALRYAGPSRQLLRRLQRYTVNLPTYQHAALVDQGSISELFPGIFVQVDEKMYDDRLGLVADLGMVYAPDDLIS